MPRRTAYRKCEGPSRTTRRLRVRKASRYEPDLNPTYQELATHYGTTVLPAWPHSRPKATSTMEAISFALHGVGVRET